METVITYNSLPGKKLFHEKIKSATNSGLYN